VVAGWQQKGSARAAGQLKFATQDFFGDEAINMTF
jgi:hypothetical protein